MTVTVVAYPRLHFGLTDLAGATPRSYGGIGASFCGPEVRIEGCSHETLVLDLRASEGDSENDIAGAVERARECGLPLSGLISVVGRPPSHVGLGSSTATTLAVIRALALLNAWKIGSQEMIRLSGRGRTSAVGINTFFLGGLVADAGQALKHHTGQYLPSIASENRPVSLLLGRWELPKDWVVTLLFHHGPPSVDPRNERKFFEENTPTSTTDSLAQLAQLYHGLIPAVLEEDLDQFSTSLRAFQTRGFKAREIAAQPAVVQGVLADLWDRGLAAGLSSLGPTVFVVHRRNERLGSVTASIPPADVGGPFEFRNSCHTICSSNGRV